MTSRKPNWLAAACTTALSCMASLASAQDSGSAGIVRISDGRLPVKQAAFHGHYAGNGYAGQCPTGQCPTSPGCPYCNYNCNGPACFGGLFQEHYCKNSPDHGYSPPAKYPLHRRGAEYTSYFPNQWYGTPGARYAAAPVVYQPTDTSQLGYSYQHVPFWQPNPNIMPQRPIPAQWHITAPVVNASRFQGLGWPGYAPYSMQTPPFGGFGGYYGSYGGYGGYGYAGCPYQGVPVNQSGQPQPVQTPAAMPTPAPLPPSDTNSSPEAAIPPIPRQFEDSAESGHIRRAGY